MQIFDISRTIHNVMPVYPGDISTEILRTKTFVHDKTNVSQITMSLHAGTHVDVPLHMLDNGESVSQMDVTKFFGSCTVLDFTSKEQVIQMEDVMSKSERIKENDIVLFKTKNSFQSPSEFDAEFIYLSSEAASFLIGKGIKAIGIDGPSVDAYRASQYTVHNILLENRTPIFENIKLSQVSEGRFLFYGIPLKLDKCEASPVRAILMDG